MKDLIKRYSYNELRDVQEKLSKKNKKGLADFIAICSGSAGKEKLRNIERVMVKIFDTLELKDFKKLNNKILIDFLGVLKKSDLLKPTKNEIRKFLKRFIREMYPDWVKRFNGLKHEGLKLVDDVNQKKINADTILSEIEVDRLLRLAESLRYKALLFLEWESAARPSEILLAKISAVNLEKETITLTSNKTGNTRTLPLKKSIVHIKRWLQEFPYPDYNKEDYLFPSFKTRDKPLKLGIVNRYLHKLGKQLGKPVFMYLIRHSKLSALHKKKIPDKIYERYADHSLKTASRYSHLDAKDLKEVFDDMVYDVEETEEEKNEYLKEIDAIKGKLSLVTESMILSQKEKKTTADLIRLAEIGTELSGKKVTLVHKKQ